MHDTLRRTCAMCRQSVIITTVLITVLIDGGGFLLSPNSMPLVTAQPYSVHSSNHQPEESRDPDALSQSEFYSKIRALTRPPAPVPTPGAFESAGAFEPEPQALASNPQGAMRSSSFESDHRSMPLPYSAVTASALRAMSPEDFNVDPVSEEIAEDEPLPGKPRDSINPWLSNHEFEIRRHPVAASSKPRFVPYTQANGQPYIQRAAKLFNAQRHSDGTKRPGRGSALPKDPSPLAAHLPNGPKTSGTCNGGDCLKNNEDVSVYQPSAGANKRRQPLLLISKTAANGEQHAEQYFSRQPQAVSVSLHPSVPGEIRRSPIPRPDSPLGTAQSESDFLKSFPVRSDGSVAFSGDEDSASESLPDASNDGNGAETSSEAESGDPPFTGGANLEDYLPPKETPRRPHAGKVRRPTSGSGRYDGSRSPNQQPRGPHRGGQSSQSRSMSGSGSDLEDDTENSSKGPPASVPPLDFPEEPRVDIGGPAPPPRLGFQPKPQSFPASGADRPSASPPQDIEQVEDANTVPKFQGGAQLSDYTAPTRRPVTARPRTAQTPSQFKGGAELSDYTAPDSQTPATRRPRPPPTAPPFKGGAELSDYTPPPGPKSPTPRPPPPSGTIIPNFPLSNERIDSVPPQVPSGNPNLPPDEYVAEPQNPVVPDFPSDSTPPSGGAIPGNPEQPQELEPISPPQPTPSRIKPTTPDFERIGPTLGSEFELTPGEILPENPPELEYISTPPPAQYPSPRPTEGPEIPEQVTIPMDQEFNPPVPPDVPPRFPEIPEQEPENPEEVPPAEPEQFPSLPEDLETPPTRKPLENELHTLPRTSPPEKEPTLPDLPPELITTQRTPAPTVKSVTPPKNVPNRLRGKAHVVCEEDGLQFRVTTLFPFTGQIFAHDRKRVPGCVHTFTDAALINLTMPYVECGIKNAGDQRAETQYHMQIIVVFEQKDGTSTIQSFIAQCEHQKVKYQKSTIPKRIEEALEELHLVPTKLEQKAPIPECIMRIVKEEDHGHDGDGIEVNMVDLGQPMRIEWLLQPESDAYGFHVRNCTVRDKLSGNEHLVIDERGCSTDINIFGHPHYDTYHDIARVHWHAFKVPDNSQLSIRCSFEVCSDIADSDSGVTSCDSIPSPPFCPDVVTSPSNSILFDYEGNLVKKRSVRDSMRQPVHADICLGGEDYCRSDEYTATKERHLRLINGSERVCVSRLWLSVCTGFSAWSLLLAIGIHGYCRSRRRHRLATLASVALSQQTATSQLHHHDNEQQEQLQQQYLNSNLHGKRSPSHTALNYDSQLNHCVKHTTTPL